MTEKEGRLSSGRCTSRKRNRDRQTMREGEERGIFYGSTTRTMKSVTEKGADVGGHLLLFINSRRGEIRPLCAVRLLVSPTHKFLSMCFSLPAITRARRPQWRARPPDDNAGHRK